MFNVEIFTKLSTLTGEEIDQEELARHTKKAQEITEQDSMATLCNVAKRISIYITPVKAKYFEALWKASEEVPVVIWCNREQDWILITKAGIFTAKIAEGESPLDRKTVTQQSLLKRLELDSRKDTVEIGIVQRALPSQKVSSQDKISTVYRTQGASTSSKAIKPEYRFFQMLMEDRKDILTLFIFSLFSGLLYLTVPLAIETVVNSLAFGTQAKPYVQALLIMGQVVAACLILQAVITGFQYYITDVIQRRIFARTTADIAYRLPRANIEHFTHSHAPELLNRFLEVVTIQKNTAFFLLDGVNSAIATTIGMILLALYHPFLLVFVILLISLIFIIIWGLGRNAVESSVAESKTKYSMLSWFEEIASYPLIFKGPGGYNLAMKRANKLATDYVNARSTHFRIVIRQIIGLLLLSVLAAVILLIGGAWLVISQQITLGQLVASEIIMGSIIGSLSKFGKKLEAWYDTMASVDKLGALFDLKLEHNEGEKIQKRNAMDHSQGLKLEVNDLSYESLDGERLFSNISFSHEGGSHIAIFGHYGSSVSGFLDLFFALRKPKSGHISIDGLDLREWEIESYRQNVLLLRPDIILGTSIIDNIRLGQDDVGIDEVHHALKAVGVLDHFLKHPEGLKRQLSIGGTRLSKNFRVSLLIARAIVQKPSLLIIDELFDGLEDQTLRRLSEIIFSDRYKWTVLFATRLHKHTKLCQYVINLDHYSNEKN